MFDIDLREFTSQDALGAVIAQLGSTLDLQVVLYSEGDFDDVVVSYNPVAREFSARVSL